MGTQPLGTAEMLGSFHIQDCSSTSRVRCAGFPARAGGSAPVQHRGQEPELPGTPRLQEPACACACAAGALGWGGHERQ